MFYFWVVNKFAFKTLLSVCISLLDYHFSDSVAQIYIDLLSRSIETSLESINDHLMEFITGNKKEKSPELIYNCSFSSPL